MSFALANVPLTAVAVAADWPATLDAPPGPGRAADTFVRYGTPLSGPVAPVVVTGGLGVVAHRADGWGVAATAVLAAMGALIVTNAARQAVSRPTPHAPRAVLLAGAGIFASFGAALTVRAVNALATTDA